MKKKRKMKSTLKVQFKVSICLATQDSQYTDRDFFTSEAAEGDESPRRATDHQRFDRRQQELTDADLARLAEDYQKRYKQSHAAIPYNGDMNTIPQRLLMPSVEDASLWQVKCRVSLL
jgi:transcription elongation factor SPT5